MPKLTTPSIQHLARQIQNSPEQVERNLIQLARNPPIFNYNPLYGLAHDALAYGQPLQELERGIQKRVKNEDVRNNFLSLAPLIHQYFSSIQPTFVSQVERRYYSAGRNIIIPFDPPLIYGVDGVIHLPWLSFWRSNPLSGERLSFFMTILDEILGNDPDLDAATVTIVDFSAPAPKADRTITLTSGEDIPRLDAERKTELLETFIEGFLTAKFKLANMVSAAKSERRDPPAENDGQGDLFPRK